MRSILRTGFVFSENIIQVKKGLYNIMQKANLFYIFNLNFKKTKKYYFYIKYENEKHCEQSY